MRYDLGHIYLRFKGNLVAHLIHTHTYIYTHYILGVVYCHFSKEGFRVVTALKAI